MGLFDGSERLRVFVIMNIVMTVVGTVACSLNIAVIKRMPTSGYLLLLLTISIFQFMEDITFFFANVNVDYWVTTVAQSFQVFGGVGGALMSNFISFIVLYIVAKRKSFNIFAWYKYMLGLCIISAIANVIMYLVARIPENNDPRLADLSILWVYYYIRLVSIFANFIMFGISAYCIRATRSMGRKKTEAEIAVTTLCGRLIFYPIVQVRGLQLPLYVHVHT